jgi:2-polyprenyl-3-methyl-5-hydroxy-6-metoxy-1,4-benzoquinol methylase
MSRAPTYVDFARRALLEARPELVDRFGRDALEETAYPVYTNSFPPAAYLGWNRVVHAQRMLSDAGEGVRALDFGAGLGVMLPFLSQQFTDVIAFDLDPDPTEVMVQRMDLPNVEVVSKLGDEHVEFDAITALDVLEHVDGLDDIYADLLRRTAPKGVWVISGPTENWLYRTMRRVAGTTGEGHVRTIFDVFHAVPQAMQLKKAVRLPFGSPVPLFLVGRFERR